MKYLEVKKPRIEIIPMIDIMLFLLVFFVMITLKMVPTSGHVTSLPKSSTTVSLPSPKLVVELDVKGDIFVEGKSIVASQLTDLLKNRDATSTAVTLVGADTVSLQHVMRVIDAIKSGGATQISLAASSSPSK